LKERWFRSDLVAIPIIALGCTLFLTTAKDDNREFTEHQLSALYLRELSVFFIMVAGCFIICGYVYEIGVTRALKKYSFRVYNNKFEDDYVNSSTFVLESTKEVKLIPFV